MTETGATRASGAAETTSEAAGEQSETGEVDVGGAAAVKEEGTTTETVVVDTAMHTTGKENSASGIEGSTTRADVGITDRAQISTGSGAESLVERQEPPNGGIKGFN